MEARKYPLKITSLGENVTRRRRPPPLSLSERGWSEGVRPHQLKSQAIIAKGVKKIRRHVVWGDLRAILAAIHGKLLSQANRPPPPSVPARLPTSLAIRAGIPHFAGRPPIERLPDRPWIAAVRGIYDNDMEAPLRLVESPLDSHLAGPRSASAWLARRTHLLYPRPVVPVTSATGSERRSPGSPRRRTGFLIQPSGLRRQR